MIYKQGLKEPFSPLKKLYAFITYKIDFMRNNPNYFYADGLVCFCGPQGSGKTMSAVNYVYNLMKRYPKAILVTNLDLRDYPVDNERVFRFVNGDDFKQYNNEQFGVIFLVDEIQLYFNSLKSKNINPDVMTQISQQRKQRKHIVCTSQVFGRMAKPLREQFSNIIKCDKYFVCFQKLSVIDRDSLTESDDNSMTVRGKVKLKSWYIHTPEYFDRYDTYAVIETNEFVSGETYIERYINSTNGVISNGE